MDWGGIIPSMTGIFKNANELGQAILALITTISAIFGALAALGGRAGKGRSGKPAVAVAGIPPRERNSRLPDLREAKKHQERLVFLNNVAGVALLPITVFAAALYLIVFAIFTAATQPIMSIGAAVVTMAMALCWLLQRNLNPQWRAKQAQDRVNMASGYIRDLEAEIARDRLSQDVIKTKGKAMLDTLDDRQRADIPVGV